MNLEPDLFLKCQRPDPEIPFLGERRLIAAVLEQALLDMTKNTTRRRALLWFTSARSDGVRSFLGLCEFLGLNPRLVRQYALSIPVIPGRRRNSRAPIGDRLRTLAAESAA